MSAARPVIAASRYTSAPFPAYRYVPGRSPHPTAHPDGHSYRRPGEAAPPVVFVPPERWYASRDYLSGCDLYNHGYWWEAHEAWEGLWQLCDKAGAQGQFLQGLIQVAACHLKLASGQWRAVVRLFQTSREHLRFTLERMAGLEYMGLELRPFMANVDAYYDRLERLPADARCHDPLTYPYLVLAGRGEGLT